MTTKEDLIKLEESNIWEIARISFCRRRLHKRVEKISPQNILDYMDKFNITTRLLSYKMENILVEAVWSSYCYAKILNSKLPNEIHNKLVLKSFAPDLSKGQKIYMDLYFHHVLELEQNKQLSPT